MSGGTRSYEMARRLVDAGHEVHVVTSSTRTDGPGGWTQTEEAGATVHWLNVPYSNQMSYARRTVAFGEFALRAGPYAAKLTYDVVFATSTPLTIAIPGVYAAKRGGVPMVFEVRDLWPELPIAIGALRNPAAKAAAYALERFAYRNAEKIVALSPGMKDGVVSTGYDPDRVHVIPNCSDIDRFRNPPGAADPFFERHPELRGRRLVMYAGTFGIINGVDYLVRVAEAMRYLDPEVHFVLIGEGHERERVEDLARDVGVLGATVTLVDPLPKAEVPHALAAADVVTSLFIDLPEMWHNSANKFFDALAASKPVAINYGGWQAELLERSGAGICLPVGDPAEAARMLLNLLDDPSRLTATAAAAGHLADTEFDRDLLAARLIEVLRSTAATSSRRAQ